MMTQRYPAMRQLRLNYFIENGEMLGL